MSIELFCKVVDNYGDAGVCGRLTRQLASEYPWPVRLWIDKPDVLAQLRIALPASVRIERWDDATQFILPPDFGNIIIEDFACGTPPEVIAHMKAQAAKPLWINLEYLGLEDWVDGAHLLPSTHPATGLVQHFFIPGFTPKSGGLIREQGLYAQRDAYVASQHDHESLRVSLFCYPHAPVEPLLEALKAHHQPVELWLPEKSLPDLRDSGSLTLRRYPFLPQAGFDELLWRCDLNLIRGEDSFVRAHWAAKPLIWQAYPQAEGAHMDKIRGFLSHYTPGLGTEDAEMLALVHEVWNLSRPDAGEVWPHLLDRLPALTRHAQQRATDLAKQPDLANQLAGWIERQRI